MKKSFCPLYFVPMSPVCFAVVLGVLAFDFGFLKLPFDAEIQKVVKGPKLNTIRTLGVDLVARESRQVAGICAYIH